MSDPWSKKWGVLYCASVWNRRQAFSADQDNRWSLAVEADVQHG